MTTFLKQFVFSLIIIIPKIGLFAQNNSDTLASKTIETVQENNEGPKVDWSGFIDVFYAFDKNRPEEGIRQDFFYNHNRHNQFNINLALIQLKVSHSKYRANLGLQTGTYAMDNYAAEDDLLKPVNEANVGVALNKKGSLWLDMGVFPSHIGFESAISSDNLTLTRSLAAENSPYFLAGAKLSWDINENLSVSGTWSNGWQRIKRVDGNTFPGVGTQITYATEVFTINWSTFVCSDFPDNQRRVRYFNDFYGIVNPTEQLTIIAGFDIGIQESDVNSPTYEIWTVPTAIASYMFSEKWRAAIRGEYYSDRAGVIISTNSPNGFRTAGFSINLDYMPFSVMTARIEARNLQSKNNIFPLGNRYTDRNFFIVGSLALKVND